MNKATRDISDSLQDVAKEIDAALEAKAGQRVAFTLIVFTEGRASYISSAARGDTIMGLQQMLAQLQGPEPAVPAHAYNS